MEHPSYNEGIRFVANCLVGVWGRPLCSFSWQVPSGMCYRIFFPAKNSIPSTFRRPRLLKPKLQAQGWYHMMKPKQPKVNSSKVKSSTNSRALDLLKRATYSEGVRWPGDCQHGIEDSMLTKFITCPHCWSYRVRI